MSTIISIVKHNKQLKIDFQQVNDVVVVSLGTSGSFDVILMESTDMMWQYYVDLKLGKDSGRATMDVDDW